MKINQEVEPHLAAWYEKFKELSTEPMDKDTSRRFMNCLLDEGKELTPELKEAFIIKVLLKRAEVYGFNLTPGLTVMLFLLSNGVAGQVVMLLSAMMYYKQTEPIKGIVTDYRIEDLVQICPMGFPSEESYKLLWDLQKKTRVRGSDGMLGSDNMLDEAFIA